MRKFIAILVIICLFLTPLSSCENSNSNIPSYKMKINYDDKNGVLSVFQEVEFKNMGESDIFDIYFNVFSNAYRKYAVLTPVEKSKQYLFYPNGINYGTFEVLEIKDKKGNNLTHCLDGVDKNFLKVSLKEAVSPNKKVVLNINFEVKLSDTINLLGKNDKTVNLSNFFPILAKTVDNKPIECPYYNVGDPTFSDFSNFDVEISCDKDFLIASSGLSTKSSVENGVKTSCFSIKNSVNFALCLSKNFKKISTNFNDIEVNYFYLDDTKSEDTLDLLVTSLDFFSKTFGEYPYKSLTVTQTSLIQAGKEFPSHIFISNDLKQDYLTQTIVHEIAHQWWYGGVNSNQIEEGYIDEGLAQISSMLFFEEHREFQISYESMLKQLKTNLEEYKKICSYVGKTQDFAIKTTLNKNLNSFDYIFKTHTLSPLFFNDLKELISKEKFILSLQNLYKEKKFDFVTSQTLIDFFSQSAGYDLTAYINAYLNGKVYQ